MKNKFNKIITTTLLLISIALGGLLYMSESSNQSFSTKVELLTATLDSTKYKFNKERGVWESSKLQYQATEKELKGYLKDKDKELYELAKKKDVKTSVITNNVLRVDTVVDTQIIRDTILGEDVRYITLKDDYIDLNIVSRVKDSNIKLKANTDLTLSVERDGTIVATPNSPYVMINQIRGFEKVQKEKKHNWKYIVGGVLVGSLVYGITK